MYILLKYLYLLGYIDVCYLSVDCVIYNYFFPGIFVCLFLGMQTIFSNNYIWLSEF